MSVCELCGEPMPAGEEMFKYHGYSGPCPKPPKARLPSVQIITPAEIELMMADVEHHRAGPVRRMDDGTLRVYYAGFNLTALAEHIARELAQDAASLSSAEQSGEA